MIFAVLDPSPLTVCINCSIYIYSTWQWQILRNSRHQYEVIFIFTSILVGVQSIVISMSACLFVCLRAYVKNHVQTSWNFLYMLTVTMSHSYCHQCHDSVVYFRFSEWCCFFLQNWANRPNNYVKFRVCPVAELAAKLLSTISDVYWQCDANSIVSITNDKHLHTYYIWWIDNQPT